MNNNKYKELEKTLFSELIPSFGCTEPIAIAYAASVAKDNLIGCATSMSAMCSRNIIKNVKGVQIPGAEGLMGIDTCVYMGYVCGHSERKMEVINGAVSSDVNAVRELKKKGLCEVGLLDSDNNLHIVVRLSNDEHSSEVTIIDSHLNVIKIVKDGETIFQQDTVIETGSDENTHCFEIDDILDYADSGDIESLKPLFDKQVEYNMAIAEEGLNSEWGTCVGRTIYESGGSDPLIKAVAYAAAGSDARMSGCCMPVYINSGSGNQGITVSVPLAVYSREKGIDSERLYRALIISNLTAVHIKSRIGRLSAFCGAVSAGCGFGAALTYLETCGDREAVKRTVKNCLATSAGIICDGAKPSCASKIAVSLETAILAHRLSIKGLAFPAGTGVVKESAEDTIVAVSSVANPGMCETDRVILDVLLNK